MFKDLYDYISSLFSSRWPTVEGVVTAVDVQLIHYGNRGSRYTPRIKVDYTFSVGDDGPYTGESVWSPTASVTNSINEKFGVNKSVKVRYRPDDPSVNKLDRDVWKDLLDEFVPDL